MFSALPIAHSIEPSSSSPCFLKAIDFYEEMQPFQLEEEKDEMDHLEVCRLLGKNAWKNTIETRTEAPGLTAIKSMVSNLHCLSGALNIKLEPFQLAAFRSAVCSRAVALLKEELFKYAPEILECLGVVGEIDRQTLNYFELVDIFKDLCKRFIAVVAPRRNGKSKAGKIFVAVNAIAENGACIVLLAHQINAVLLYKDDILHYLELLQSQTRSFSIKTNSNTIKLVFKDATRQPSTIHFVAGGYNVSICLYICMPEPLSVFYP